MDETRAFLLAFEQPLDRVEALVASRSAVDLRLTTERVLGALLQLEPTESRAPTQTRCANDGLAGAEMGLTLGLELCRRRLALARPGAPADVAAVTREILDREDQLACLRQAAQVEARQDLQRLHDAFSASSTGADTMNETLPRSSTKSLAARGLSPRASLLYRDLREQDLSGADLRAAVLTGSDLRGADLRRASLVGADLRGVRLDGADLARASLAGVSLVGASLTGCDLTGTLLLGADLRDADLSGCSLDAKQRVEIGFWNERTRWPSGFTPRARNSGPLS